MKRIAVLLLALAGFWISGSSGAASTPKRVEVANVAGLYAAVNDPANAGVVVKLAPGAYALDPSYPNGGRIELQPDMTLLGQEGDPGRVRIDASGLPPTSYQAGLFMTGAVRMGRGTNAIEWLTVEGASNGVAGIETDLYLPSDATSTQIRIAHVVVTGGQRGIDVRNVGAAQTGRVIDAFIGFNTLAGNRLGEGMGLRAVNTNGASDATIRVTLQENDVSGNLLGLVADNLSISASTTRSTVRITSTANRVTSNGTGGLFMGGVTFGRVTNANLVVVESHGDAFIDSIGPTSSGSPGGGILVLGAFNSGTQADAANDNTVFVTLTGSRVENNQNFDVSVFGARSTDHVTPVGLRNHATVALQGVSKKANALPPVPSDPVDLTGTNTAVIVQ